MAFEEIKVDGAAGPPSAELNTPFVASSSTEAGAGPLQKRGKFIQVTGECTKHFLFYNPSISFSIDGCDYIFSRMDSVDGTTSGSRLGLLKKVGEETWALERIVTLNCAGGPTGNLEDPCLTSLANGKWVLSFVQSVEKVVPPGMRGRLG